MLEQTHESSDLINLIRPSVKDKEIIKQEGLDAQSRYEAIIALVPKLPQATSETVEKKWTEGNVTAIRDFLIESAPLAHPKVFPNYWDHLLLTSIYAQEIAKEVGSKELVPLEAESLGLIHDPGRLVAPHRYFRNDAIARRLLSRMGIEKISQDKLPQVGRILGIGTPPINTLDDVLLPQRILDVADNLGKRNSDGTLFNSDQMVAYTSGQSGRYQNALWPSAKRGLFALDEQARQKTATDLVLSEIGWLREYSIDFDKLRQEVEEEFKKPENQSWLTEVKNAQESLDPAVDKALGRPAINTVVFDFGNVLCEAPDEKLIANLASSFGCSPDDVSEAFAAHNALSMDGKISEEEYLMRFYQTLGKTKPDAIDEAKAPFIQTQIYKPIEGMQEILESLSKNPNINIYVLCDAIGPLAGIVKEIITTYYPKINQENIFISSEIKASKSEVGALAFQKMIDVLKEREIELNPQQTLFIDDQDKYSTAARAKYGMRGFTFRGSVHTTPQERLREEVLKAGLIQI